MACFKRAYPDEKNDMVEAYRSLVGSAIPREALLEISHVTERGKKSNFTRVTLASRYQKELFIRAVNDKAWYPWMRKDGKPYGSKAVTATSMISATQRHRAREEERSHGAARATVPQVPANPMADGVAARAVQGHYPH